MGKKVTKNRHDKKQMDRRTNWISTAIFAVLVLGAVGVLYGMAKINSTGVDAASDQYVQAGSVEVAAVPLGAGYYDTNQGQGEAGTLTGAVQNGSRIYDTTDNLLGNARGQSAVTIPEHNAMPDAASSGQATLPAADVTTPSAAPATPEAPAQTMPSYETLAPVTSYEPSAATITITAVGDCTLGGNVPSHGDERFDKYVQRYGYDYFFDKVRLLFESDDLTIVNLEGPLTTSDDYRHGRGFNFRGKPEYVSILSGSSVEIANVANNHSLDYGKRGLLETSQVLENAGIGCSGFGFTYDTVVKTIRVRSIGFTEWDFTEEQIVEDVRKAREGCDLLIVSMHWGREGDNDATSTQRRIGRAVVDAGADLVIGNHTHVYGGFEKYNGKYIIYSLGNFCFGGNGNPSDKRCLIFQQSFSYVPGYGMIDRGINVIPALVSGERSKNNFQPVIQDAEDGAKLIRAVAKVCRLNGESVTWMSGNYLERNGLIAAAGSSDQQVLTDARPTEEALLEDSGMPTIEDALRLEVLKGGR